MTTLTASSHRLPAGEACSRRRTTVAPMLPNADRVPPSMPKSPRRRQRRREIINRDRRSAADYAGQHYPHPDCCPIKSP
jgi:hypothetical protein